MRPRTACRSSTGIPGSHRSSSIDAESTRQPGSGSALEGSPSTALGLGRPVRLQARRQLRVPERQDRRREERRVVGVADGDRRDRDPARHLDDRQQRVQAAQVLGGDRHADHRQASSWRRASRAGGRPRRRPRRSPGSRGRAPSPRSGTGGPASGAPTRPAARTGRPAARAPRRPSRAPGSPTGCRRRCRRGPGPVSPTLLSPPSAAPRGRSGPGPSASSASLPTTVTWPILRRSNTRRLP